MLYDLHCVVSDINTRNLVLLLVLLLLLFVLALLLFVVALLILVFYSSFFNFFSIKTLLHSNNTCLPAVTQSFFSESDSIPSSSMLGDGFTTLSLELPAPPLALGIASGFATLSLELPAPLLASGIASFEL